MADEDVEPVQAPLNSAGVDISLAEYQVHRRRLRSAAIAGGHVVPDEAQVHVWSTKGDGSFALVGVPFYVDGTRGEVPQDAMEWIIDASLPAASLFALCVVVYTVGVALGLPPY